MEENSNNNEFIIKKITDEIIKEITEKNLELTEDEINQKIEEKISAYIQSQNDTTINIEEEEKAIRDEFFSVEENEDNELIEKFNNIKNDIGIDDTENQNIDALNNSSSSTSENNEDIFEIKNNEEKKKSFFDIKEIKDLYKEELKSSIACFKNILESFKIMAKTSIIETIGIIIALIIPAFIGGIFALLAFVLFIILWQINLIFKIILKYLYKVEDSIKNKISEIKLKLYTLKTDKKGGFLKRLLFSSALYSIVMFNGLMYLLIKGLIIPVRSAHDIEKMVANVIQRGAKAVTNSLRAPSELSLTALGRTDGLKSGKVKNSMNGLGAGKKLTLSPGMGKSIKRQNKSIAKNQALSQQTPKSVAVAKKTISPADKSKITSAIKDSVKNQLSKQNNVASQSMASAHKQQSPTQSIKDPNINKSVSKNSQGESIENSNKNNIKFGAGNINLRDLIANGVKAGMERKMEADAKHNNMSIEINHTILTPGQQLAMNESKRDELNNISKAKDCSERIKEMTDGKSDYTTTNREYKNCTREDGTIDSDKFYERTGIDLDTEEGRNILAEARDIEKDLEGNRERQNDIMNNKINSVEELKRERQVDDIEKNQENVQKFKNNYGFDVLEELNNWKENNGMDRNAELTQDQLKNATNQIINEKVPEEQQAEAKSRVAQINESYKDVVQYQTNSKFNEKTNSLSDIQKSSKLTSKENIQPHISEHRQHQTHNIDRSAGRSM